jgi:hypothetical protein
MEIELIHQFEAPLAAVISTLEDPTYTQALVAEHSFFSEVQVLSLAVTPTRVARKLRYRGRPLMARLGPFSLPSDWFTWTEHSVFDRASRVLAFENVSEVESVRDKFVNRGTMRFEPQRSERGLVTTRISHFELDLKVARVYAPLRAAALRSIATQLESSLEEEARFLARSLASYRVHARPPLPMSA